MKEKDMIDSYTPTMSFPIIFSANDYFVPYTAVMIQSMMEYSHSDNEYHIFILHQDISLKIITMLEHQISEYSNFSIEFINVSEFIEGYNFFTGNRNDLTIEAYFRLLIPDLFQQYEKVLYLDGDMLCHTDIADLFAIRLDTKLLAAVRDLGAIRDYYRRRKRGKPDKGYGISTVSNPDTYFNSGMLILNIRQFRETLPTKKLLEFAVSNSWKMHDQDVLNILCENRVLLLPLRWNFIYPNSNFEHDNYEKYLPDYLYNEYQNERNNPNIIHLAGSSRKPWENWGNIPYFEDFWKYATRTPFIDIILDRMKKKKLAGMTCIEHTYFDIINGKSINLRFIIKCLLNKYLHTKI
jgi:lipopolysaccharide biosynthesis glycosyltransferase